MNLLLITCPTVDTNALTPAHSFNIAAHPTMIC